MDLAQLIEGKGSREDIQLKCPQCQTSFTRKKNDIQQKLAKGRKHLYCSKECSGASKKLPDKECLQCGVQFHQPSNAAKFCSRSCSITYNNLKRGRKPTRTREAFNKDRREIKDAEIAQGLLDGTLTDSQRQTVKTYLIRTKGHKCEVCGLEEWQGQAAPLVLDHIDGNSGNNFGSNLRLVCGNCDMQLPTYKAKNKGNGRAFRRERYAEGKSF